MVSLNKNRSNHQYIENSDTQSHGHGRNHSSGFVQTVRMKQFNVRIKPYQYGNKNMFSTNLDNFNNSNDKICDSVAESLFRIQDRLNRTTERRN